MSREQGSDGGSRSEATPGEQASIALPPTIGGPRPLTEAPAAIAGRYRVLAPLGRGSFGEVWEADDRISGARVAVKLLLPGSGRAAARVRREIVALRLLRLPGVARLIDEGVEGDQAFLVMEKVVGAPFPGVAGPRPWDEIARPALALLGALAGVHAAGIVHRDLKPANVLVDAGGRPTILDFGLAQLIAPLGGGPLPEGAPVGTPAYLAPEQLRDGPVTARADLYAVGVMLYQALSGRLPHEGRNLVEILRSQLRRRPEPLSSIVTAVPPRITDTLDRLLAIDPAERPASALEALRLLQGEERRLLPVLTGLDPAARLGEPALRALFAGPDRLLHLQEDAARLLFERSEGLGLRVAEELERWEQVGLCRRDGERWVIDRPTLDAMESGLLRAPDEALAAGAEAGWSEEQRRQVHRARAASLPAGAPLRLGHLLAGSDLDDPAEAAAIAAEALLLAQRLAEEGRLGRAAAALAEGVNGAQAAPPAARLPLFALWAEVAITEATPEGLDRALYQLCREGERGEALAAIEALLRGALAFRSSDRGAQLLDQLPPFPDGRLERARLGLRALAARRRPVPEEEALLREIEAWANASTDPARRAAYVGLLGRLRYRQGRYEEAAALQIEAAAGERWTTHRLNATLNAASALLEASRLDEAVERAEEARALAQRCRHAFYEARAAWILRAAGYRLGRLDEVDSPLLEAITRIGVRDLEALAHLTEAAIAFRAGDLEVAATLAEHARKIWSELDDHAGPLLCRALSIACGAAASAEEISEMARGAIACPVEGIGAQVLGLLARGRPERAGEWAAVVEGWAQHVPFARRERRGDVLSLEEARRWTQGP